MEAVLDQETEQTVETPEAKSDPLQEVLNRMNERDSQESEVVEDAAPTEEAAVEEEVPEQAPEPVKVEGPSVAMKTLAKQYGVDEELLGLCQNDEQVNLLIEKTVNSRDDDKAAEPQETPVYKPAVEWPEGEVDENDPVYKNLNSISDFASKGITVCVEEIKKQYTLLEEVKEELKTLHAEKQMGVEEEFDSFMDSLNATQLGNRAQGDVSDIAQGFRYAMFQKFDSELKSNPRASRRELLEQVANAAGFTTKAQVTKDAIKASASQVLGGAKGNGPPAPPKKLSAQEMFRQKLAEINARPHNKES